MKYGNMINRMIVCMCMTCLAGFSVIAQDNSTTRKVEIPNTRVLQLNSAIVGQEYTLHINLPGNYSDSTKTFPVLYLLDGQWDFPLLSALYGEQYFDGFIPGLIVVGITWGGKDPNPDQLRARDFTPTAISQVPKSGNAPKFLQFIKQELVPFIDSKFRTAKNDRTLTGSSLGGLFTLYALFNETALFNRYVLTSPAVGWDNEVIYSFEKNYSVKSAQASVRLFMGIGALEPQEGFKKLADHLEAQHYTGLTMQTRVLENTGHSGGKAEGYTRGLQFVFAKPAIKIAPGVLEKYTGAYQLNPGTNVMITSETGKLIVHAPGGRTIELSAETENDFYAKGIFFIVHFKKDNTGKVTGLQLDQFGSTGFWKKEN